MYDFIVIINQFRQDDDLSEINASNDAFIKYLVNAHLKWYYSYTFQLIRKPYVIVIRYKTLEKKITIWQMRSIIRMKGATY